MMAFCLVWFKGTECLCTYIKSDMLGYGLKLFLTGLINHVVIPNLQWLIKKQNSSKVIHYKEIIIWPFYWDDILFAVYNNFGFFSQYVPSEISVVFKFKLKEIVKLTQHLPFWLLFLVAIQTLKVTRELF